MARSDGGGGSIPIYKPPKPKVVTHHGTTSVTSSSPKPRTTGSGGGGGKGGSGGGGGGGSNPYLAAQKKAQHKAANRYLQSAKAMQGQIAALKHSLSEGFKSALTQRLANITLVSGQQDAQLLEGYGQRVKSLEGAAKDNEASEADASFQNLGNSARERANAVSEAMNNGAGESDVLKAGMMSLRSWDANQGDVNRSFFDTLRSVNSSLTDLNVDTKTSRMNVASQANADRDQVYSQYYGQRSETLTQLGNLYGQQGEYYGMAQEQVGSKKTKGLRRKAVHASDNAFMRASKANAQVWDNPGVGDLANWQGREQFGGEVNNNRIETAVTNEPVKAKPEGATLRKWSV